MTQKALAREAGITERNLQNIEYGDSTPNVYLAKKISKALKSTVDEVFPDREENTI